MADEPPSDSPLAKSGQRDESSSQFAGQTRIGPPSISDRHVRLASIAGFVHQWARGRMDDDVAWRAIRAYVLDAERFDEAPRPDWGAPDKP